MSSPPKKNPNGPNGKAPVATLSKDELKARLYQRISAVARRKPQTSLRREVAQSTASPAKGGGKTTETKQMSIADILREMRLEGEPGAEEKIKAAIQKGKIKTQDDLSKMLIDMVRAKAMRERASHVSAPLEAAVASAAAAATAAAAE